MFPFAQELGATHSLVSIADELKKLDHEIIFASFGKYNQYIRDSGYEVIEIIDVDLNHYWKYTEKASMGYHNEQSINKFVEEEVELINRMKPDLIIDILRPTLKISSKITNTKRVTITNTVFSKYYSKNFGVPKSHWLAPFARFAPAGKMLKKLTPTVTEMYYRHWAKPYNKVLTKYGHEKVKSLREMFEGDLTILMDAFEFAPVSKLPSHIVMVGPLLHTKEKFIPDWYQNLDKGKKIIFLSMGSTGRLFTPILEYLHQEYSDSKSIQVIATTAGRQQIPSLNFASNFFITDYIPAELVLSLNNCAINITHGGKGSIYHALTYGVPIIGIPHLTEQEWNLDTVVELGAGLKLEPKHLTKENMLKAIDEMLSNTSYYTNAQKFKEVLYKYEGQKQVARLVNEMFNYD